MEKYEFEKLVQVMDKNQEVERTNNALSLMIQNAQKENEALNNRIQELINHVLESEFCEGAYKRGDNPFWGSALDIISKSERDAWLEMYEKEQEEKE